MEIPFVGFPKIPRWSGELIITEKIDGTNAQIYIQDIEDMDLDKWVCFHPDCPGIVVPNPANHGAAVRLIMAGSRNRWLNYREQKQDNFGFAAWVFENRHELAKLGPGQHFGEWWGRGIGRNYDRIDRKFSLFNPDRYAERPEVCHVVPRIPYGTPESAMGFLQRNGSQAAPGFMNPEGIIIYHTRSRTTYKMTFEHDKEGKERAYGSV